MVYSKLTRQCLNGTIRAVAVIATVAVIGGCARDVRQHGSQLDEQRLQSVRVGAHTKNNVLAILGSPASVATFDEDAWYYISGERETRTPFKYEELERTVLVVHFDANEVVREIEIFGLEQSREVEFVERETPSSGQSITVMQQLLGNIGRFEDEGGSGPPN